MKPTDEQRRWQLVLDDPQSPPELKVKAAEHLKIKVPANGSYSSELDRLVQSYWGTSQDELEQRHPIAARVYSALVTLTVLGGNSNTVVADVETVLDAFAACKTEWVRRRCTRALLAALFFHRDMLPADVRSRAEAALNTIKDFGVFQQPEEKDFLGLLQDAETT